MSKLQNSSERLRTLAKDLTEDQRITVLEYLNDISDEVINLNRDLINVHETLLSAKRSENP